MDTLPNQILETSYLLGVARQLATKVALDLGDESVVRDRLAGLVVLNGLGRDHEFSSQVLLGQALCLHKIIPQRKTPCLTNEAFAKP